jgi:hypothetical protein
MALKTKILKNKSLSTNDAVRGAMKSELSKAGMVAEIGTPAAKVHSRLLSSKVLAAEIASVMDTLRITVQPTTGRKVEGEKVSDEEVVPPAKKRKPKTNKLAAKKSSQKSAKVAVEEASEEDEGKIEDVDGNGWESGSVSDGDEAALEAGWESGTISSRSDQSDEWSGSDEENEPEDNPTIPSYSPKKATNKAGESTFLPSLAVGFTRGDSDSDFSDSEAKIVDGVKKNRRGQRARRAYVHRTSFAHFD